MQYNRQIVAEFVNPTYTFQRRMLKNSQYASTAKWHNKQLGKGFGRYASCPT